MNPSPSRAKRSKPVCVPSTLHLYVRQSEGEGKQASTENQQPLIDRCVATLRAQGIVTDAMQVVTYRDIGGARYDYLRPDFLRFMSNMRKGDVSVVAWRDRLGSGTRYPVAVEDIVKVRGARLFIADPHEEITWDKTRGLVESIHGSQSQAYIDDLKVKTTAALRRQLAAGYAAGDPGFGYKTEVDPSTRRVVGGIERFSKWIRVNDEEKAIVLRIFELKVAGAGWLRLVKTLNKEGARTPRGGAWTTAAVWDVLHNRKYIGEWTMGVRKVVKEGGKKHTAAGDDPIVILLPHLALVPPEVWSLAHNVMEARSTDMRGNLNATKHLLSGVVRCAECGGGLSIAMQARRGKKSESYVCSRHRRNGECAVTMHVPAPRLEAEIVGAVEQIFGSAANVIKRVVREVSERSMRSLDVGAVARELEAAQAKLQKVRRMAYATGDDSEETMALLRKMGERVRDLEADNARATSPADGLAPRQIEKEALSRLADLRKALSDPGRGREALHRLFPQGISLRLTPSSYEITGRAEVATSSTTVAQPDGRPESGQVPLIWPQ